MTASIDIGMEVPILIHQKSIDPVLLANDPKFPNRTLIHLLDPGDHPSAVAAFILHPFHVALKPKPLNGQTGQIKNKKQQREINRDFHLES